MKIGKTARFEHFELAHLGKRRSRFKNIGLDLEAFKRLCGLLLLFSLSILFRFHATQQIYDLFFRTFSTDSAFFLLSFDRRIWTAMK